MLLYVPPPSSGPTPGMWVSRPGLGLETDQDHFFEVLVLVLASLVLVLVSACLVLVSDSLVLVLVLVSTCLVLVWSWSRTPWS